MERKTKRSLKFSKNVYTEFPAGKSVKILADYFWSFNLTPFRKKLFNINFLPTHHSSLVVYKKEGNPPFVFFHGPSLKTIKLKTDRSLFIFGICLTTYASLRYFKLDHGALLGSFIGLNKVIGKREYRDLKQKIDLCRTDRDYIRTFTEFLQDIGKSTPDAQDETDKLCRLIIDTNGEKRFDEYYSEFHTNKRSLQRNFKKTVGFSPKEFARLVRIQQASSDLVKTGFKHFDIMFKYGYYDQSHYIKEFRKFMGSSPKDFELSQKKIDFKFIEK